MTPETPTRPVVPVGGDSGMETGLRRPREGDRVLVSSPSAPEVTDSLLLTGARGAPESLRIHIARTLEMEWVSTRFSAEGEHLRVTLTGPADRVRDALDVLPGMYRLARRGRG